LFVSSLFAQTLLSEDFSYSTGQLTSGGSGANVSGGNWSSFSGTANYIPVSSGSLTYTGYPNSGVGNKIDIISTTASAEDASRTFNAVTTGKLYASFLVNITDTVGLPLNSSATGDYFVSLQPTTYFARVVVRKAASTNEVQFGIKATSSATAVWASGNYAIGTTHLIAFAYEFVSGTLNDVCSLWVNPALTGTEPAADAMSLTSSGSSADATSLSTIAVRQGTGRTPNASIDGIRVGLAWTSTPMPVVLTSFTASKNEAEPVMLKWATASEVNNSHFDIQRSIDNKKFETIGSVKGAGTSVKKVNYSFTDAANLSARTVYYRLKQVDFDGKADYSKTVSIVNTVAVKGISSTLPNPFNDELDVTITAGSATTATVVIMDMIGKVHHTSTEQLQAGSTKVNINTADMPDGIYFVRVSYNGDTYTQKVIKK